MAELLIDLKELKKELNVRGVIHAGAHLAEEYETYKAIGAAKILYIEANTILADNLKERFKDSVDVEVVEAVISDTEKDAVFKIHSDTHTSSLLEMAKPKPFPDEMSLAETHPEISVTERRNVRTISLDGLFEKLNTPLADYNLLTIDVQGVEVDALRGCVNSMRYFNHVYIEVETWELYEGGKNYAEVLSALKDYGFTILREHIRHWGWGDILFTRLAC